MRGVVLLLGVLILSVIAGLTAPRRPRSSPTPPRRRRRSTCPPRRPAEPQPNPETTFHAAPKPLPKGAVTHDWPSVPRPDPQHRLDRDEAARRRSRRTARRRLGDEKGLGLRRAGRSSATGSCCSHRVGDEEVVDCLHRETGERFWRHAYPTDLPRPLRLQRRPARRRRTDRRGGRVYTLGAEGKLHCLELSTGRVRWQRDLLKEFKLQPELLRRRRDAAGRGGQADRQRRRAAAGRCVAAFDAEDRARWSGAPASEWGPSYAVAGPRDAPRQAAGARLRRRRDAAGEKPTGGLLCIDPANGAVDFTFPWRGRRRESVNASSPLVVGDDRVFVSECYGSGGALLRRRAGLQVGQDRRGRTTTFGTHFMTAVHRDGHLYGVDGHGPQRRVPRLRRRRDRRGGLAHAARVGRIGPARRRRPGAADDAGHVPLAGCCPVGDGRVLCLGEFGHLLWVDLSPPGYKEVDRARLFLSRPRRGRRRC